MKVLLIGDSHTGALNLGHAALLREGHALHAQYQVKFLGGGHLLPTRFFEDRGDHAEITEPEYRKQTLRLPPSGASFDMLGFSGPLHTLRLWHHDWRAHTPWTRPPAATAQATQLLSDATVRRIVDDDTREVIRLMEVLRRSIRLFVVAPPRPFRHHPSLQRYGADRMMALDARHRAHVTRRLSDLGVPIVDIDLDCVAADGTTRAEYRSAHLQDTHHANAAFGRRMILKIDAFVQKSA